MKMSMEFRIGRAGHIACKFTCIIIISRYDHGKDKWQLFLNESKLDSVRLCVSAITPRYIHQEPAHPTSGVISFPKDM